MYEYFITILYLITNGTINFHDKLIKLMYKIKIF